MYALVVGKLNKHAGAIILTLALLGSGSYAYTLNQVSDQANCQGDVNLAVSKNIKIRAEIAARDTEAKTLLLDSLGNLFLLPETTNKKVQEKRAAEFLQLFRDFKVTMSAVAVARAENPVPELSETACN